MNLLQKKLLKTVVTSRTSQEAMLKAGYKPETARTQIARTFRGKSIQEKLKQFDNKALRRFDEAFDAEKIEHSLTEPDVITPDHQIRLKAVDMQFKARGVYTGDSGIGIQMNTIIINKKNEYGI